MRIPILSPEKGERMVLGALFRTGACAARPLPIYPILMRNAPYGCKLATGAGVYLSDGSRHSM
jgi:hypothetical protein